MCNTTGVKLVVKYGPNYSGPGRGYYPKPSKSILILHVDHLQNGKQFGLRHECMAFTGAHYFGGFIGDDKSKHDFMQDCMLTRENKILLSTKLRGDTAKKFTPQWSDRSIRSGFFA